MEFMNTIKKDGVCPWRWLTARAESRAWRTKRETTDALMPGFYGPKVVGKILSQ